jgi:phospholipid-binding lipoprotein MlaA
MFGLVDWASDMGLKKQNRGIGKALGRWGIGSGPYLVVPFVGPLTVRDSTDPIFNWTLGIPAQFNTKIGSYSYLIGGSLSTRASLLPYEKALDDQLIFDKYAYIRDSYLQKRYSDVYRGNPPMPFQLGNTLEEDEESIEKEDSPPAAPTSPSQ